LTEGIGLPSVNNLALSKANGRYIIRLDGDDVFEENILLILSNYLDQNEDLALVFPDYYLVDDAGGVFSHEWRRKLHAEDHVMDEPPNGACTMFRVDVLRKVGNYRVDLGAQDGLDIWLKVKDKYKSMNVNLPLFYYRRHGQNLTEKSIKIINARRNIKRDKMCESVANVRPIIAVIPCRRNYDFVEDLWAQKISGKSLLERDIEICMSSDLFDYIIVSSDNEDVSATLKKYKEEDNRIHLFLRDSEKTSLSVSIVETLNQIIEHYDPALSGIVLMRHIQTPFVTKDTIEEAISTLVVSDADCAFSIEKIHHEVFEKRSNGLESINKKSNINNVALFRDASTCVVAKSSSLMTGSLRGAKSVGFPVSTSESFFIRCSLDLEIASYL